jgi:aryl-alcohol dehydrogenase-like predicted oxidoreductase
MKYTLLGRSGLRVSELCLGTMTFGGEGSFGSGKAESKKVFDSFVKAGGNFLDTANIYTGGNSEKLLGEFVGKDREQFVIATKYTMSTNPLDPNASGNHRKNMMQAVHASLKRLNTDYIDLLWVHAWDKYTPIEEMMRGLDDLVRQGKVFYVGASDMPAWAAASANTMADLNGWSAFVGLQLEYSLIERTIEREYFEMAKTFDLTICPWSPIGGGVLTGKYNGKNLKDSRFCEKGLWTSKYITEHNLDVAKAVVTLATELGKTPAQIALNWVRQKYARIIPIIGAKNVAQLDDNLGCLNFTLTETQMKELDQANPLSLSFPQDFLRSDMLRQTLYGNTGSLQLHQAES